MGRAGGEGASWGSASMEASHIYTIFLSCLRIMREGLLLLGCTGLTQEEGRFQLLPPLSLDSVTSEWSLLYAAGVP